MTLISKDVLAARGISEEINRSKGITFQAISWYAADVENDDGEGDSKEDHTRYTIKAFGTTEDNKTIAVTITDFTPYFWVKLQDNCKHQHIEAIKKHLLEKLPKALHNHFLGAKIYKKKDFWGFTNFRDFNFLRFTFQSHNCMRRALYILNNQFVAGFKLQVFEANIDPYIRFMHVRDIEPSRWIHLPEGSFRQNEILKSSSQIDVEVKWSQVNPTHHDNIARFLVASFDIECMSDTGDFPVAMKDYNRLATDVVDAYTALKRQEESQVLSIEYIDCLKYCILQCFHEPAEHKANYDIFYKNYFHKVRPMSMPKPRFVEACINKGLDDMMVLLQNTNNKREDIIRGINQLFTSKIGLPKLHGDSIIQIGTTFHFYGDREVCYKHIITLGSCDAIDGAEVVQCQSEDELLLEWSKLIRSFNPDILTGYNIFGFDMSYMNDRAKELGIDREFLKLGRLNGKTSPFMEARLSSSALGDNILKYVDMEGRVLIDMMKVVQRDHKLESYKLDNVAFHFLKQRKNDVSPHEIFTLQREGPAERKRIADYCLQDCALCNYLVMKLEIIANNMGMSNVCLVPLSFIFMRGQGVKIFSLVLKQCKDDGFVIPVVKYTQSESSGEDESYEGAIVLEPKTGIYLDHPITVLDYASLYPSSMISENLSHDCIVLDKRYDNLPGVEYLDISYDIYEGEGNNKVKKEKVCRFAQLPNNEKGIIPRILMKLLKARKTTRKKMEWEIVTTKDGHEYKGFVSVSDSEVNISLVEDNEGKKVSLPSSEVQSVQPCFTEFQKAVLDGLQLAYKVTANSLYGQIGAKTSPIYLKDIAACTTATGRNMIIKAKKFVEDNFDGAYIVYGDTDSIFVQFKTQDENGNQLHGEEAREKAWQMAQQASKAFKSTIKAPHDLEVDKLFHPFILLSKKRYVGNKYEGDMNKYKQTSMGIVLKRRDNANIVKKVYGGAIDIILNERDIDKSIGFLNNQLEDLIEGKSPIDDLIITKSLRAEYKDPDKIAHKVLSERIGERDPGNKPQVNDRIPFVYVEQPPPPPGTPKSKNKILQGDRIEHPDFINKNNLRPDYSFYITNQIMKPVLQLYATIAVELGVRTAAEYDNVFEELVKTCEGDTEKAMEKLEALKEKDVKKLLFDKHLDKIEATRLDLQRQQYPEYFDSDGKLKKKTRSTTSSKKQSAEKNPDDPLAPADRALAKLEDVISDMNSMIKTNAQATPNPKKVSTRKKAATSTDAAEDAAEVKKPPPKKRAPRITKLTTQPEQPPLEETELPDIAVDVPQAPEQKPIDPVLADALDSIKRDTVPPLKKTPAKRKKITQIASPNS